MSQQVVEFAKASNTRISGRLGQRHKANTSYLLHIYAKYGESMLEPFRHRGQWQKVGFSHTLGWDGEYAFKWLDAAVKTAASTGHDLLTKQVNSFAESLRSLQEADGYMGIENADQKGKAEWDIWNQWYALTGWLTHYELMQDEESLSAAAKVGEWIVETYGPVESKDAWFFKGALDGGCNIDVIGQLVRLYEFTGSQGLLNFVGQAIEQYPAIQTMRETGKAVIEIGGGHGETPDKMHAYVLSAYLGGVVEYALAAGQDHELDWIESVWDDLVDNHLYPTGSLGYKERLRLDAPNDSPDMEHQETCATVEWMLLNRRLYGATGKVRYVHMLEKTAYNALLAAQSVDGMKWDYYTPLRYHKRWGSGPTHCCYWSGPRGVAMLPELVYATDGEGLYVNLLEQSEGILEVKGRRVTVEQVSEYPGKGEVSLQLGLGGQLDFALRLRIPAWAESVNLRVNGESCEVEAEPGEYIELTRTWADGDRVGMTFDVVTRLLEMKGYGVAVSRGPEVMSLDSRDNEARFLDTVVMDSVSVPVSLELVPIEPRNGRRLYAGQVLVNALPRTVTFTPYADAGAIVVPHEPMSGLDMSFFEEGACFRTVFSRAE